ncbi:MAG: ABC transporter permease [Acidimicrobiia bacterium]
MNLLAQTKVEVLLTLRRGETLLVTVIIPAGLLIFFTVVDFLPQSKLESPVDFYLPGTISIAVAATSMVSLGIATAFERYYGVLKRLGGTPLTRGRLLVAKGISVFAIEAIQAAVVFTVAALFLDWAPRGNVALIASIIVLGSFAFAALGLMLAGRLRAELNLALVNGLFLLFILLSGLVVPIESLPGPLASLAEVLPAAALTDSTRWAIEGGAVPTSDLVLLSVWGLVPAAIAASTFKWE